MSSLTAAQQAQLAGTSSRGYNNVGDQLLQFGGGLDVNTDPFILDPPYTTTANDLFYQSPGQIQALPLVSNTQPQSFVSNVYSAGALPAFDPYQTGSGYEIAEVSRYQNYSSRSNPAMLVRTYDGKDPAGPTGAFMPYLTKTRSVMPLDPIIYSDNPSSTNLVSAPTVAYSPNIPSRMLTALWDATNQQIQVSVVNQNSTTLPGTNIIIQPPSSSFQQFRLISDPNNANVHYAVLFTPAASGATTLWVCTLITQNSTYNLSTQSVSADKGTYITFASATQAFDCATVGGKACVFVAQSNDIMCIPLVATANSTVTTVAVTNYSSYQQWNLTTATTANLSISATVEFATPTSNFVVMAAEDGYLYRIVVSSALAYVSSSSTTYTGRAQTVVARPQGGNVGKAVGALFAHATETFGSLTNYGYSTASQSVQQINITYFSDNGAATLVEQTTPFRTLQGSMVVTKAFCPNRDDTAQSAGTLLGNPTEAFYCAIVLGANLFDGEAADQTYFVIDHLGKVVSRFNELLTPNAVYTNTGYKSYLTQTSSLSAPFWLIKPNDATLFEFGIPYISPNALQQNPYPNTPTTVPLTPAAGSSLVEVPQAGYKIAAESANINLATFVQSQQGVLAPVAIKGKSALISGGLTKEYDGRVLHESGFHMPAIYPGKPVYTAPSSGSPLFPTGTFIEYETMLSWTDNTGLRHISNNSYPRICNPGSSGANNIQLFIPSPIFTEKSLDSYYACYGEIYKTFDTSGAVYFAGIVILPNGTNNPMSGSLTSMGAVWNDNVNTTPPGALSPYDGGAGEYKSDPAPPFLWQVNSQGRAFGLACVQGTYRIYFSSPFADTLGTSTVQDQSPRWNSQGFLVCPFELGDVRSIAQLDTSIYAFGTRGIGVFSGSGPAALQLASTKLFFQNYTDLNYTPIAPLPVPAGIVGCGSPITAPAGIIYQDRQGLSLIDRSQTVSFIGKTIDDLTTQTRYGIPILYPQLQIIVFPNNVSSQMSLVCDYNGASFAQWQSCGNIVSGYVRQDGGMYLLQQTPTSLSGISNSATCQIFPSGSTPSVAPALYSNMVVETPWLNIGQGFSGEGELWDAILIGKYFQPHTLKIEQAFNYGTYSQVTYFYPGTDTSLPTVPYQYRIRPQGGSRNQTVRYRISVINTSGGNCECARLTGIMLWSANFRGLTRMGYTASR